MKNFLLTSYFILSFAVAGISQTVNSTEIYISPNSIFSIVSDFTNTPTGKFINDGNVNVYANLNNNGMVDFLGDTGKTSFVGNLPQSITGTNSIYLYNVLFSNLSPQPAFQLSGSLSVANESDFDMGIVDLNNYGGSFVFEQFASAVNTSNDSFVDGQVIKLGNNSFVYPIGDAGYYRFAGIDDPKLDSEMFSGKYYFEETNIKYPTTNLDFRLELIDNSEYWTIERLSGDSDVMVTLSWDEATTPAEIFEEPNKLIRIARWDENSQLWIDEGGIVDSNNNTVTAAVSGYGVFTLARLKDTAVLGITAEAITNVFTPNGDSVNDEFEIPGLAFLAPNFEIKIVNRWGNLVYEYKHNGDENAIPNWWDGYSSGRLTINGNSLAPAGVYYYTVDFNDGKTKPVTGWVYLNR